MEKYSILEADPDTGLHIIRLDSGDYSGLLLSLYNIGCDDSRLFYNFNILNEKEDTDMEFIECILEGIINDIYFKECE